MCIYLEPPSEPREPGIVDFDNKSITLRWNKPKVDGGRPITHFIIQKKDQFGGKITNNEFWPILFIMSFN